MDMSIDPPRHYGKFLEVMAGAPLGVGDTHDPAALHYDLLVLQDTTLAVQHRCGPDRHRLRRERRNCYQESNEKISERHAYASLTSAVYCTPELRIMSATQVRASASGYFLIPNEYTRESRVMT